MRAGAVLALMAVGAAVRSLEFKVATFNVERLGDGKMGKPDAVEILLQAILVDQEAILVDHEAILVDHEAILVDHEAILVDHEAILQLSRRRPAIHSLSRVSVFVLGCHAHGAVRDTSRRLGMILDDYDLVCIQELTDADGSSVPVLLGLLNAASGKEYTNHTSPRLGRTTYKEQYLFLYEPSVFQVEDAILYDDTADDIFEREPYYVTFRSGNFMFTMGTIHVKPDDAVPELIQFAPANDWVTENHGMQDFLLLGDFNADCDYVSGSDWDEIGLWTQPEYRWLVDNDADTTVNSNTDCAYARVVAKGPELQARISDVRVRRFDEEFGLEQAEALDVSDHYPVEFTLTV
ncbi:unnamed protein product [Darwinula stevensoni]|uniref:Endonuclease/exonuclease/phosphatase domain-containing protein n=1 Tax=Darwinula stevensoni TaxID=69355 RepID=A0A7R9A3G6_9CRUS|nr:unnamed protein product [Darwinula stevensoni]CAG0887861.1 unnamed protein product [Darwinula stevensoni]